MKVVRRMTWVFRFTLKRMRMRKRNMLTLMILFRMIKQPPPPQYLSEILIVTLVSVVSV